MGRERRGQRPRARSSQTVTRPVLLDASFLVALEHETARGERGPARTFLTSLRGRRLVISIVSVEEILEGAANEATAFASLQRFTIQGLHLAQARRCALLQRRASRRMGENDAWLVATADSLNADVVGEDRAAFDRLGERYLRFRK
jgi:predicted nucleic acid-binding protein